MSKAFLAVALNSTGLTLGMGVGVAVGLGLGVGVGVGSTGLKTELGDGFGAALIATPLFQTSFVPNLMQVNFFPDAVAVVPALLHFAPALGVAACAGLTRASINTIATTRRLLCCMNYSLQSI
jgi:hypothetical protein